MPETDTIIGGVLGATPLATADMYTTAVSRHTMFFSLFIFIRTVVCRSALQRNMKICNGPARCSVCLFTYSLNKTNEDKDDRKQLQDSGS